MIRKDDLVMENQKSFTIEELAEQCEEARKNFEALNEQFQKAKQEEEDRKRARSFTIPATSSVASSTY